MCMGSAPAKPGQVQTLAMNNSPSYTVQDGFHLREFHGRTSLKWLAIFAFPLTLGIAARKLYRQAKRKERLRNLKAEPVLKELAYQPPKPSMYEEVLRGPSLVTEQAFARYLLRDMWQNHPMPNCSRDIRWTKAPGCNLPCRSQQQFQ